MEHTERAWHEERGFAACRRSYHKYDCQHGQGKEMCIRDSYESTLSGLLPERQAQRMIQQYDEEQILLERRVAELENLCLLYTSRCV